MEMVKASPDLSRFIEIHGENKKTGGTIFCHRTRSYFRPLGADSTTLDGLNPHAQIVDELHEHKDRRVWAKLQTATGARRQPLTIAITTAGVFDPPRSAGNSTSTRRRARRSVRGRLLLRLHRRGMDDGDDVFSVETQKKANPNYGVSAYRRSWKSRRARRPIGRRLQRLSPLPPESLGAAGDALDPAGEVGRCDPPEAALAARTAREEKRCGRGPVPAGWTSPASWT
jgi:phage terminase large subunit-like protein